VSFVVNCDTQEEIDLYWNRLTEGGQEIECGWLQDRFGVSWQVVPNRLIDLLAGADEARTQRIMAAVMQMKKLDLATLENAAKGP
jgi:predicted 3-demethylubiquinone-9 3-methyltransferase (glyoxalase superfamily)